jgi:hypothetical protein
VRVPPGGHAGGALRFRPPLQVGTVGVRIHLIRTQHFRLNTDPDPVLY